MFIHSFVQEIARCLLLGKYYTRCILDMMLFVETEHILGREIGIKNIPFEVNNRPGFEFTVLARYLSLGKLFNFYTTIL